jgi:transposase
MKPWTEITHYAGFDWAREHHDVVIVDRQGQIVADFRLEHTWTGWQQFRDKVKPYPGLAVAIETSQGAAVDQVLALGCTVYPVNPLSAKCYHERKAPSGHKTDRLDAWSLAEALRLDGSGWKTLDPLDPLTQQLQLLCRDEMALVEQRTALVNQLQQALVEYYPAPLQAFDDGPNRRAGTLSSSFPPRRSWWRPGGGAGKNSCTVNGCGGRTRPPNGWTSLPRPASSAARGR